MREAGLRESEAEEWHLLGLSVPKGMAPFTAILQQGLMHGTVDVREAAAAGLGELIEATEPKALQAFVVQVGRPPPPPPPPPPPAWLQCAALPRRPPGHY